MQLDIIESLEALKRHGIHVARTKVADSAEDAVAFSERRIARDMRMVPIVLSELRDDAATPATISGPLENADAIRHAYERMRAHGNGRILAQTVTPHGTDIIVSGETDEQAGRTIEVSGGTKATRRMVPLGTDGAAFLAAHVHGEHRPDEKTLRLLENVFLRFSEFFEAAPEIEAFRATLRLHENSYTVVDATITAPRHLDVTPRKGRHDRDRKSYLIH